MIDVGRRDLRRDAADRIARRERLAVADPHRRRGAIGRDHEIVVAVAVEIGRDHRATVPGGGAGSRWRRARAPRIEQRRGRAHRDDSVPPSPSDAASRAAAGPTGAPIGAGAAPGPFTHVAQIERRVAQSTGADDAAASRRHR